MCLKKNSEYLYYEQEKLKIAEELDSKIILFNAVHDMAVSYQEMKNYEKFAEYTKRSLKLIPDMDDDYYLTAVYFNIARAYYQQLDFEKALEFFLKSLTIADKYKDLWKSEYPRNGFIYYHNLGGVYKQLGNLNEALMYYKKGIENYLRDWR